MDVSTNGMETRQNSDTALIYLESKKRSEKKYNNGEQRPSSRSHIPVDPKIQCALSLISFVAKR